MVQDNSSSLNAKKLDYHDLNFQKILFLNHDFLCLLSTIIIIMECMFYIEIRIIQTDSKSLLEDCKLVELQIKNIYFCHAKRW